MAKSPWPPADERPAGATQRKDYPNKMQMRAKRKEGEEGGEKTRQPAVLLLPAAVALHRAAVCSLSLLQLSLLVSFVSVVSREERRSVGHSSSVL